MEATIRGEDIILMILQYLKSSSLPNTFNTLQTETGISFSLVRSREELRGHILAGRWDQVMTMLKDVSLPQPVYALLYEQIICELIDVREFDLASYMLKQHAREIMGENELKYRQLVGMVKTKQKPGKDLTIGRREQVAQSVCESVVEMRSASRLLDLIQRGLITRREKPEPVAKSESVSDSKPAEEKSAASAVPAPQKPEAKENVPAPKAVVATKEFVQTVSKQRWTSEKYHLKAARFSQSGSCIATASADGFIEILDSQTLQLRTDLSYQNEKKFMLHEARILCLDFSSDDKMLCSGDESGMIRVWRIADGRCLRKLDHAHTSGVTCCKFMAKNSQVVSGSFSSLIRVHGLRSGSLLREFSGHGSYISDIILLDDESTLMSSSSDGTIKIWDARAGNLRLSFSPGNSPSEISINNVVQCPDKEGKERFLVCNRSPILSIIDRNGKVLQRFNSEKPTQGDFVAAIYSQDGKWVYAAAQDLNFYVFSAESGLLESTLKGHSKEVVGMSHHPTLTLMLSYAFDGYLFLWKP